MKRILLLILVFFTSITAANAGNETVTVKGHLRSFGDYIVNGINYEFHKYTYSDGSVKYLAEVQSKKEGYSGNIAIPDKVHASPSLDPANGSVISDTPIEEDYTIVGIKGGAFKDCTELLSFKYSDSLEEIGKSAFEGCTSLSYFGRDTWNMANHIKTIGERAFFGCSQLSQINTGDNLIRISDQAFEGCTSLKSVLLHQETLEEIGERAFAGCTSLTEKSFMWDGVGENNLETIKSEAFLGCSGIESFKCPKNVKSLYDGVFKNCTGLKTVELNNKITVLSQETFMGCTSLSKVLSTDNLTFLGYSAFEGCTSLKEFVFPSGLKYVCNECFQGSGIESVELPEGMEEIFNYSFYGCKHLKYVKLPSTIKKFQGGGSFQECESIVKIKSEIKNPFGKFDSSYHNFDEKTYNTAILIVPKGTSGDYKVADFWKYFKNIYEEGSEPEETNVIDGDVNGDGEVNEDDIAEVEKVIIDPSAGYDPEKDVNHDGVVNVADIVAIVNIISSPNTGSGYFWMGNYLPKSYNFPTVNGKEVEGIVTTYTSLDDAMAKASRAYSAGEYGVVLYPSSWGTKEGLVFYDAANKKYYTLKKKDISDFPDYTYYETVLKIGANTTITLSTEAAAKAAGATEAAAAIL